MLGQCRLNPPQQLAPSQQIEHGAGIRPAGMAANALLLPHCRALLARLRLFTLGFCHFGAILALGGA